MVALSSKDLYWCLISECANVFNQSGVLDTTCTSNVPQLLRKDCQPPVKTDEVAFLESLLAPLKLLQNCSFKIGCLHIQ